MRPVAITEFRSMTALGRSPWEAIDRGVSGVRAVPEWLGTSFPVQVAARVQEDIEELEGFPDDRKVGLLAAVARMLSPVDVDPERLGVFLGTGLASMTPMELSQDVLPYVLEGRVDRARAAAAIAGDWVAPRRRRPERATAWLCERLGARGVVGTSFSACAASAEAIVAGVRAIARGEADVVIAGGHDAMIHPLGALSFLALGALAAEAGRPFDRRRDGFVLGEGATLIRLERAERSRSAIGWVWGAGASCDAWGVTAPHPDGVGAHRAMLAAMEDAEITASDVGWVKAHATGTPAGDAAEAAAIARLLGSGARVSSLKGALGHTLAASGANEMAVVLASFGAGTVPPTVGCEQPDDLDIDVVCRSGRRAPGPVLCNSFGFGGQNVCVVVASECR
jgi:3-oxoacyl-[acyl-carrier-protein] synthase II